MKFPDDDQMCADSDQMAAGFARKMLSMSLPTAAISATAFIKAGALVMESLVGREQTDDFLTALLMAGKQKQ